MVPENLFCIVLHYKTTGRKICREPRIRLFKQTNNSVCCVTTFYLEDDDYKSSDFNGETISFTCKLVKI